MSVSLVRIDSIGHMFVYDYTKTVLPLQHHMCGFMRIYKHKSHKLASRAHGSHGLCVRYFPPPAVCRKLLVGDDPNPHKIASGAVRLGGHSGHLAAFTKRKNAPRQSEAQTIISLCALYAGILFFPYREVYFCLPVFRRQGIKLRFDVEIKGSACDLISILGFLMYSDPDLKTVYLLT